MAEGEEFGALRAALHGARTPEVFARVLEVLREGFDADAEVARRVWMPYARAALEAWPDAARHLTVGERDVDVASGPWLAVVRSLRVEDPSRETESRARHAEWVERALGWLVEAPEFASLRRLDLSYQRLKPGGAKVVARAEHLGALEELDVSATRAQSLGLQALARAPFGANLRRLVASNSRVGVAGFEAVARSTRRLVELDLSNNPARGGLGHLARSEHLGALERLDVSATQSDEADLSTLSASEGLGALVSLNISGNRGLGDDAMAELAGTEWLPRLEEFRCARCGWRMDRRLSIWFEQVGRMNPRVLELDGEIVEDRALGAFVGALMGSLRRLELSVESMTPEQSRALCSAEWISGLEHLSLNGILLDEASTNLLAERVREGRLERMSLWNTSVADAEAAGLLEACATSNVRELALGGGVLGATSARRIAALDLGSLRRLNLRMARVMPSVVRALAESESLSGLEDLRLGDDLTPEDREVIQASKTLPKSVRASFKK